MCTWFKVYTNCKKLSRNQGYGQGNSILQLIFWLFSNTSCTACQMYCSTNQELNTVYILESQHFCWHCSTNEENKKSELVSSLSAYRSKQSCEDEVINLALISVIGFCFVSDNLIKSNLLILCFFFFAWFNQPLPLHLIRSFVNLQSFWKHSLLFKFSFGLYFFVFILTFVLLK